MRTTIKLLSAAVAELGTLPNCPGAKLCGWTIAGFPSAWGPGMRNYNLNSPPLEPAQSRGILKFEGWIFPGHWILNFEFSNGAFQPTFP